MSLSAIAQLEQGIRNEKVRVELAKALERLEKNKDFKLLITEGYFREEAIRLVNLRGDTNVIDSSKQANILRDMDGIAGLVSYFQTIRHLGEMASRTIEANEEMLQELLAEDLE